MKVFISWSGQYSRGVALALRGWLPAVISTIDPFVSSKDIHAGSRWQSEIADELDATNFGIVCVTKENQSSPWLTFEAGALAKSVDLSRVVPLAVDLKPSDIAPPLGQFQAQPATEEGIAEILKSINASCTPPLDDALLTRASAKWWPDLESDLAKVRSRLTGPATAPTGRSERDLLEEVLNTVRSLARRVDSQDAVTVGVPKDHPALDEVRALLQARKLRAKVVPNSRHPLVGLRVADEDPGIGSKDQIEIAAALTRHGLGLVVLEQGRFSPSDLDQDE